MNCKPQYLVKRMLNGRLGNKRPNAKKIRSKHQELNFRVQNLDENRQFLFKQTAEYEQKLTNHAHKQRNLLMAIDKLKTQQNDIENIKLRSIALNLQGATEILEKAMQQARKLDENRQILETVCKEKAKKHTLLTHAIQELTQKRDLLAKTKQREHELRLKNHREHKSNHMNDINAAVVIEIVTDNDNAKENENDQNDEEMITIFDNTLDLQSSYDKCEQELEAVHVTMGRVVLEQLNTDKELVRIHDMLLLQQETLESMEHSRMEYSQQQERYLKLAVTVSTKISALQSKLNSVKD
eukprot:378091_1